MLRVPLLLLLLLVLLLLLLMMMMMMRMVTVLGRLLRRRVSRVQARRGGRDDGLGVKGRFPATREPRRRPPAQRSRRTVVVLLLRLRGVRVRRNRHNGAAAAPTMVSVRSRVSRQRDGGGLCIFIDSVAAAAVRVRLRVFGIVRLLRDARAASSRVHGPVPRNELAHGKPGVAARRGRRLAVPSPRRLWRNPGIGDVRRERAGKLTRELLAPGRRGNEERGGASWVLRMKRGRQRRNLRREDRIAGRRRVGSVADQPRVLTWRGDSDFRGGGCDGGGGGGGAPSHATAGATDAAAAGPRELCVREQGLWGWGQQPLFRACRCGSLVVGVVSGGRGSTDCGGSGRVGGGSALASGRGPPREQEDADDDEDDSQDGGARGDSSDGSGGQGG
ncbi:hypothetical protein DFJ73DRAFT_858792 [Zopfochytrium polystomum]|nr:hypothetical protein DFJ73DRAFT_858792 [Zopfochytrium polystomum]